VTFTRARDLIAAAAVAGVLVNLVLQQSYGAVPTLPQPAGTTLLIFAIAEVVLGNTLRARIRQRPGSRPVQALTAAKAVVLAKASSLAGAITGGGWLGVLAYVLPLRSELASAASDTVTASIGTVCAAALVAAALWLEHCCKAPRDPDDPPNDLA
jgi:DMSO reductase anchor subunit